MPFGAVRSARCLLRGVVVAVLAAAIWSALPGVANASTAHQAEPEEPTEATEAIGGFVRDEKREPVEGVRFVVRDGDGVVGRGETDDTGEWLVGLPGPGTYRVKIVVDTLPKGVSLRDPTATSISNVEVDEGQIKRVIFALGPPREAGRSDIEVLSTLLVAGIRFGLVLAVCAIGLSMIFGVTGLVNFAHGELVTFGAIMAYFFADSGGGLGVPLIAAAVLAMMVAGGLGYGLERFMWRPLRAKRTGNIALIVVSIGLGLVLRHLYLIAFGESPRPYEEYTIQKVYKIGPVSLPPKDYVMILICVVVLVGVGLLLQRTRMGIAMRAVADERDLAEASGVDVRKVIMVTWVSGAALAALGGVMQGLSDRVVWDMGLALLLLMFAATLLGGLGTAYGAMVGGLVIGVVTEVGTFWISSKYKLGVALVVLIAAVLFRPQGLLGRSERVG